MHRIQDAGMEVRAGMILGFANANTSVFDVHRQPLAAASRRDTTDAPLHGTNVMSLQMSGP